MICHQSELWRMMLPMQDRSSKNKKSRREDANQAAARVLREATGESEPEKPNPERKKNPAAVELGRRGGLKGGKARAKKLTPEQRSEIARKAAKARWSKEKK